MSITRLPLASMTGTTIAGGGAAVPVIDGGRFGSSLVTAVVGVDVGEGVGLCRTRCASNPRPLCGFGRPPRPGSGRGVGVGEAVAEAIVLDAVEDVVGTGDVGMARPTVPGGSGAGPAPGGG